MANLETSCIGTCNKMVEHGSPSLRDGDQFTGRVLGLDVEAEVVQEILPLDRALSVVVCVMPQITCRLDAAL